MHGNARANIVEHYFQEVDVQKSNLPARNPELNPIYGNALEEKCWQELSELQFFSAEVTE